MTYTPIPRGTEPWDEQVNNAFTDQDVRITENSDAVTSLDGRVTTNSDQIYDQSTLSLSYRPTAIKAMVYPPELGVSSTSIGPGNICMMRMELLRDTTITNILVIVGSAGSGLSAGQNLAGLYAADGTRLGVTADQSTEWTTAGFKEMALTSPVDVVAGSYYVALISVGTTRPGFTRGMSAAEQMPVTNYGLGPATYRYAFGGLGQTTLPTTIDMSTRTALSVAYWAGIS